MNRIALIALLAWTSFANAATTRNDDSCDIAVLPAATLLLPYFEVDLEDPEEETTIFTITNVTGVDQVANAVLWTDRSYPVINFSLYLTGYDVQAIDLHDVIGRGIIASEYGPGTERNKRGKYSGANPSTDVSYCDWLPGALDNFYVERMQEAFTRGVSPDFGSQPRCEGVGSRHDRAVGYVTIDVTNSCEPLMHHDRGYWTDQIAYDNVLIGDYQQVSLARNEAQGGPMVHIRAVPEGGTAGTRRGRAWDPGFGRTFYSRFQAESTPFLDARQPLPSLFAARWIDSDDPSDLQTTLKVWREGRNGIDAPCSAYAADDQRALIDVVTFDENENATGLANGAAVARPKLPATSRTDVESELLYPQLTNGAKAGWMYLNLDAARGDDAATQAWVITSMRAEGRYSIDIDAVALGNGCSAPARTSEVTRAGGATITPAPNVRTKGAGSRTDNDDSCDIALLPAATLLLPYFEVDTQTRTGQTTLVTITNVSPLDQIARVTLWTDYSYPVLTFNIYLTGYDAQSIDLYDVLARGIIGTDAGTGLVLSDRGPYSERHASLDLSGCGRLPGTLPAEYVLLADQAFRHGVVPESGDLAECNNVGNAHDNAVGYATIDVVRNCDVNQPTSREYWTADIAYDNVLIGDSQHIDPGSGDAQSSPLVHIRAIPEGGTAVERRETPRDYDAGFARTFYARYQPPGAPNLDGRQPLPSTFAARWSQGGTNGSGTWMKVWRGSGRAPTTCPDHDNHDAKFREIVRFDESENAVALRDWCRMLCIPVVSTLAATSMTSVADDEVFPQLSNGAVAGWIYMNLDDEESPAMPSQNWVVVSMRTKGPYSIDFDAAALGNGCSAPGPVSNVLRTGGSPIGPRP